MTCNHCGETGIHPARTACPKCGTPFPVKRLPAVFNGWLLFAMGLVGAILAVGGFMMMGLQGLSLMAPVPLHGMVFGVGCVLFCVAFVMGFYALLRLN